MGNAELASHYTEGDDFLWPTDFGSSLTAAPHGRSDRLVAFILERAVVGSPVFFLIDRKHSSSGMGLQVSDCPAQIWAKSKGTEYVAEVATR